MAIRDTNREWLYNGAEVGILWVGGGVEIVRVRRVSAAQVSVESDSGRIIFRMPELTMLGAPENTLVQLNPDLRCGALQRDRIRRIGRKIKAAAADPRINRLSPDTDQALDALRELQTSITEAIASIDEMWS
jgi:hypothetical protein